MDVKIQKKMKTGVKRSENQAINSGGSLVELQDFEGEKNKIECRK